MSESAKREVDVLVAGAGPVGLSMACELLRHGLTCRLIDQNDGPTPMNESRALGIQARTLEVFRITGVVDRILAQGRKLHGLGGYSDGRRIIHLTLDFEGTDTPYPFIITLAQSKTERVLLERLGELGGVVERQTRLTGFTQDDQGVTATVADASGSERPIRASWLIGCDGARSVVRHSLGLGFEGGEYEERFLLADVQVSWSMPEDEIAFVLTPDGMIAAFPVGEPGRWRLVDTSGVVDTNDPGQIIERFRTLIHQYASPGAVLKDPNWTSAFHIHRRVVDRYRVGRCFVAGDAAHLHSPAGGQGMNTGIQDTFNLAWKLALVTKGAAHESLLDSYQAERRPVAASVVQGADWATRVVTLRNEVAKHLRDRLLSVIGEFDFVRRQATLGVSELAIGYRRSPIVAEDRTGLLHAIHPQGTEPGLSDYLHFSEAPRPGERAPDVVLESPTPDGPARLFDILVGTRHTLLLIAREFAATSDVDNLIAVGDLIRGQYDGWIRPWLVVASASRPENARWKGDVLVDAGGALHRRFGAASACLYLIRPDGYIGYRSQPPDAQKLRAYLSRIFANDLPRL